MLCAQLLSCVRFFATPWICPWSFPVKNTGRGCRFLLQGLFPTQRLNLHPLHPLYWRVDSFYLLLLLLLSHFSRVRLCATPSLEFSRQEHWSGWPFPSPMHKSEKWKWSRSVMSNSSRPHGLQPSRFLCPWDFPGKRTGVGCHCLLSPSEKQKAVITLAHGAI